MEKLITGFVGAMLMLVLIIAVAFPLEWCWNYVMPYEFGFKTISFWQSLAMYVVAATLLKGTPSTSSSKK